MRFCVKVKNKPCIRRTGYMRLISWIHPCGSERVFLKYICAGAVRMYFTFKKLKKTT